MVGTCQEIHATNIHLPAEHEVLDVEASISEEESNIEEGVPAVLAIDDSAQEISAILIEIFVEEQSNDE